LNTRFLATDCPDYHRFFLNDIDFLPTYLFGGISATCISIAKAIYSYSYSIKSAAKPVLLRYRLSLLI